MTELDQHLDNILKASGSGLKNYSMQKTLNDMRNALKAALAVERAACASVADKWVFAYPHPSGAIADEIRARGEA